MGLVQLSTDYSVSVALLCVYTVSHGTHRQTTHRLGRRGLLQRQHQSGDVLGGVHLGRRQRHHEVLSLSAYNQLEARGPGAPAKATQSARWELQANSALRSPSGVLQARGAQPAALRGGAPQVDRAGAAQHRANDGVPAWHVRGGWVPVHRQAWAPERALLRAPDAGELVRQRSRHNMPIGKAAQAHRVRAVGSARYGNQVGQHLVPSRRRTCAGAQGTHRGGVSWV